MGSGCSGRRCSRDDVPASPRERYPVVKANPHDVIPANKWGISKRELRLFLEEVCDWYPHEDPTAHLLVKPDELIYKTTKKADCSWSLSKHEYGLEVKWFVTHTWAEGVKEFCRVLVEEDRVKEDDDGFYICFLSNPQTWSWERLNRLLNPTLHPDNPLPNPEDSAFAKALSGAGAVIAVRNTRLNMYSRLWCVYELFLSLESGKPIHIKGSMPTGTSNKLMDGLGSTATCSSDADKEMLKKAIEGKEAKVDKAMRRIMRAQVGKVVDVAKTSIPAVLWAHGLDDVRPWRGVSPSVAFEAVRQERPDAEFHFPKASHQRLTCDGDLWMQHVSWFDIVTWKPPATPIGLAEPDGSHPDRPVKGLDKAVQFIHGELDDLVEEAGSSERIILGGFSQGGVVALLAGLTYPKRLAGIVSVSGWAVHRKSLQKEVRAARANMETPCFFCYGAQDVVIDRQLSEESVQLLTSILGDENVTVKVGDRKDHVPTEDETVHINEFILEYLPR